MNVFLTEYVSFYSFFSQYTVFTVFFLLSFTPFLQFLSLGIDNCVFTCVAVRPVAVGVCFHQLYPGPSPAVPAIFPLCRQLSVSASLTASLSCGSDSHSQPTRRKWLVYGPRPHLYPSVTGRSPLPHLYPSDRPLSRRQPSATRRRSGWVTPPPATTWRCWPLPDGCR